MFRLARLSFVILGLYWVLSGCTAGVTTLSILFGLSPTPATPEFSDWMTPGPMFLALPVLLTLPGIFLVGFSRRLAARFFPRAHEEVILTHDLPGLHVLGLSLLGAFFGLDGAFRALAQLGVLGAALIQRDIEAVSPAIQLGVSLIEAAVGVWIYRNATAIGQRL